MPAPDRRRLGAAKEALARAHLERAGLRLVEANYRCRGGEIDLIMGDGDALVFVEVRYRAHDGFGGAAASVTVQKQRRIALAARHYLQRHGGDRDCRFDVVAIGAGDRLQWLRNAFEAPA